MSGTSFKVGDRITLKKLHPCGGRDWEVYRIGADIGMKCLKCSRRMMLTRRDAERKKNLVSMVLVLVMRQNPDNVIISDV